MENWINLGISIALSIIGAITTSLLTMGKYREKIDRLEKDVEKITTKAEALRSDVDKMTIAVGSLEKNIDKLSGYSQSHSPISLTEKGQKVIDDSGFSQIFENIKEDLLNDLENQNPRSQYDAQEKARMMLGSMTDDKRFRSVEKWAYENGEDFAQILRAGAIPLRDYYFEKHPEIVDPKEQY